MAQSAQTGTVPNAIEAKLRSVGRRGLLFHVTEGLLLTATVFLAAVMLAMLIDWLVVLFNTTIRTGLTVTSLAVTLIVFAICVIRPVIARIRLSVLARDVDDAVPRLEERWSTVTELAESEDPPELLGAPSLIKQVSREAEAFSDDVRPRKVVSAKGLRRPLIALTCVVVPLAVAFLLAPTVTSVLLQRFVYPGAEITMTRIISKTGSQVVARGEPLVLEARTEGVQRDKAILFLDAPSGEKSVSVRPDTGSADQFAYKLRSVEESFRYRFRAGDGETPWCQITALKRPNIAAIKYRVAPPEYSKLEGQEGDALPRRCRALRGSEFELAVLPSKPIDRLELRETEEQSTVVSEHEDNWYRYRTVLADSVSFTVSLVDEHGLENEDPPACRIIVYEDRPPQVEIVSPEDNIVVPPDDTIDIKFLARDDLGIASAEILLKIQSSDFSETQKTLPIPLGDDLGGKQVEGTVPLELEELELEHGDLLSYEIRVADSRQELVSSYGQSSQIGEMGEFERTQMASADETGERSQSPFGNQDRQGDESSPTGPGQTSNQQPGSDSDQSQKGQEGSEPKTGESSDQQQMASGERGKEGTQDSQTDREQSDGGQTSGSMDQSRQGQQQPQTGGDRSSQQQQVAAAEQDQGQQQQSLPTEPSSGSRQGREPEMIGESKPQDQQGWLSKSPPNDMVRRVIKAANCSTSSKTQRIQVDEWAGRLEGQMLEKLQIVINEYLERLDKALAAAETPTDDLRDHLQEKETWEQAQHEQLEDAREHITEAIETIAELKAKATNTPYHFISLELHEIGHSHVTPAQEHLTAAAPIDIENTTRLEELDQASLCIHRARKLLADLTRQFDAIKREQKLAEALERVAKMHQLFIEDMQAFLMSKRPVLNPRSRDGIKEVSEEFVKQIQERYEKLKELLDELAKALAEDPELLRRFMALARMDADSIRDQLTILALRQKGLHEQLSAWIAAATDERPAVLDQLMKELIGEQMEMADAASLLNDNMITWLPRGTDAAETGMDSCWKISSSAALGTLEAARRLSSGEDEQAVELAEKVADDLEALTEKLAIAAISYDSTQELVIYSANRMAEAQTICAQERDWADKVRALNEGNCSLVSHIDQYQLALDTVDFGIKVDRLVPMLGGLSPGIREKALELLESVDPETLDHQLAACMELQDEALESACSAQADAMVAFATAEELFDELLTMIEKMQGQCGGGSCCRVPTLEEVLRMLEHEQKACEKLGTACCKSNVSVQHDWQNCKPQPGLGSGSSSGLGSGRANARGQSRNTGMANRPFRGELTRRMAEAEARAAQAQARRAMQEIRKASRSMAGSSRPRRQVGQAGTGETPAPDISLFPREGMDVREWDTLVSPLREELRQSRENVPPEKYQAVIDAYFRLIAELVSEFRSAP